MFGPSSMLGWVGVRIGGKERGRGSREGLVKGSRNGVEEIKSREPSGHYCRSLSQFV